MTSRIEKRDRLGLKLAGSMSLESKCIRRQVGACLMARDGSVIQLTYNGTAPGLDECEVACPRAKLTQEQAPGLTTSYESEETRCSALHAEWNLAMRANWDEMKGSTLYITCEPCYICSLLLQGSPIERVVWPEGSLMWRKEWSETVSLTRRVQS